MRFTKWYADCVTPEGALFIGYVAHLTWGPLRLAYVGALESPAPGEPLSQRQSWRHGRLEVDAAGVRLLAPRLGVRGTWTGGVGTPPHRIVDGRDGLVTWQALRLAATAEVTSQERTYRGAGYAEVVRMTLPPWRLPFTDLDWGRFVADDATTAHTWTRTDGGDVVTVTHPAGAHDLTWGADNPIRVERVARTLFGRLTPFAARLLPRKVRHLHEAKHLARGRLSVDGVAHAGWVIHEQVRFG